MTTNQICNRAFRIVTQSDEDPSSNEMVDIREAFNSVVKNLQNSHVHLWTKEKTTKTFTASSEVTGTDGSIYTCILSHTSSLTNKPVDGPNYTTYWTKRGTTGGVWVVSTSYGAIGDFTVADDTIGVEMAFVRDGTTDHPVEIITIDDYFLISEKSTTGIPSKMVFHRKLTPQILLYPQPGSTSYVLHYLRVRKLEDFDSGENTADFPESWINPLTWALAAEIGPEFGVSMTRQTFLESKAMNLISLAKKSDYWVSESNFIRPAFQESTWRTHNK
jgi:hypothetical protein